MATVAINGLGRIGRATLKVLTGLDDIHIAAINDELLTACSPAPTWTYAAGADG